MRGRRPLLEVLNQKIRSLPGVRTTETFVYLKLRKQLYNWGTDEHDTSGNRPVRGRQGAPLGPLHPAERLDHAVPTIVRGEGHHIWDDQGRKYIDGLSGLFVVQAGHGRTELAEAARVQAEQLAFFPLWSYAHPQAIDLAERLAAHAPGDLNHVFFTTGGGEAVETAWKLAKNYFKLTGRPNKYKVISRFDRLPRHHARRPCPITGLPALKQQFEPLVPGAHKVPNTNEYRAPEHLRDDPKAFGRWAADRIGDAIEMEGPDSVAAVFLEPVQNAGGCFHRLPGTRARARDLRPVRRAAGVRRGHLRVRPHRVDLRVRRLRLRAGHDHVREGHDVGLLPHRRPHRVRQAVRALQDRERLVRARLHLRRAPRVGRGRERQPGPVRARGITAHVKESAPAFRRTSRASWTCRSSATCAREGFFYGIELVKDKTRGRRSTRTRSERLLRGFLSGALYEAGLYCRADDRGDPVIQLAPPLTCGQAEFDEITGILRGVLTEAWARL